MSKEVRIELTESQKAKIRAATGKTVGELRVTRVGKNVAVTPATSLSSQETRVVTQDLRANDLSAQDMSITQQDLSAQDMSITQQDLSAQDLSGGPVKQ
jgi:hypothetical protein